MNVVLQLPRCLFEHTMRFHNPETKVNVLFKKFLEGWFVYLQSGSKPQSFDEIYERCCNYTPKRVLVNLCMDVVDNFIRSQLEQLKEQTRRRNNSRALATQ